MLIVKEDIISRINNGDAKAFEQLYTTFYVYLCAVATKYVYNSEAAREIVNDVFMNVWNHHSALIHPVNAYLIRSVRNYCLNYLRDKRQQEVPLSDVQENLLSIQELQIDADPHPLRVQIKIGLAKLRELLGDLYPLFLLIFNFFEK